MMRTEVADKSLCQASSTVYSQCGMPSSFRVCKLLGRPAVGLIPHALTWGCQQRTLIAATELRRC